MVIVRDAFDREDIFIHEVSLYLVNSRTVPNHRKWNQAGRNALPSASATIPFSPDKTELTTLKLPNKILRMQSQETERIPQQEIRWETTTEYTTEAME